MLPKIELLADVDVLTLSPLVRGMIMTVSYANTEGGIGLTATGAMNRKFVHWAAVHFEWPDYTCEDLYSVNKVLNEADMPPLWVVRDMLSHLKLLRRKKDTLLPTKRGRDFLARPQAFFNLIATDYLYAYIHDEQTQQDVHERMRWWHVFLNLINIKAGKGCSLNDLVNELYPSEFILGGASKSDCRSLDGKVGVPVRHHSSPVLVGIATRRSRGIDYSAGRNLPQDTVVGCLFKAGIRHAIRIYPPLNCVG